MFGVAVPFHISVIKNVTKSEEGEFSVLRINFIPSSEPNLPYIRALSFRSTDAFHISSIIKTISELKRDITARQTEIREKADMMPQAALQELPRTAPKAARLNDLFMRPTFEGRRVPGDLDVHGNGIRYRSMLRPDQKVDILFENIKHLFFQPCDNEMIVLIHVHLYHPIMIGKKKTRDVQFYREAMEAIVDETGSRRRRLNNFGDEDEIIQEQEERKKKAALNVEFKAFAERLAASSKDISVDVPLRELGFYGVPFRQTVFLMPTRDALIHLTDPPFLVVTMADVEVASLERVLFGLKHFDLIFVWKDHERPPQHIDSIPISHLEPIRAWLDASDIYTMTSTINFNWTNVMKTIQDDPVGFYEMGGWSVIQARPDGRRNSDSEEDGDSASTSSSEEDSVYEEETGAEEETEEDEESEDEYSEEEEEETESELTDEDETDEESEDERPTRRRR